MAVTTQHITGFIVGIGAAGLGFYLYKKNQKEVDDFLRKQGLNIPSSSLSVDPSGLSLEDLVREKERLEDLIAEREMAPEKEEKA